jgi:hypothetical protein
MPARGHFGGETPCSGGHYQTAASVHNLWISLWSGRSGRQKGVPGDR